MMADADRCPNVTPYSSHLVIKAFGILRQSTNDDARLAEMPFQGRSQDHLRLGFIGPVVRHLWEDNYRVYGARKIWKAAQRAGYDVGLDQRTRLMRAAGIARVRRGSPVRTAKTDSGPQTVDPAHRSAAAWCSVAVDTCTPCR